MKEEKVLKTQTKIWISVVVLGLMSLFIFFAVTMISFFGVVETLFEIIMLGAVALLCIMFTVVFGAGLLSLWKEPTLTKKKEELLAKWLLDHHWSLCNEPVKLIFRKSMEFSLEKDGHYDKTGEKGRGGSIVINSPGGELRFSIDRKEEIPFLEDYSYILLNEKYMAMFFEHDPRRVLIYKQTP